jgi:PAS domain-containing protein
MQNPHSLMLLQDFNELLKQHWTPIFDQLQDVVLIFDEHMRIVKANDQWFKFRTQGVGNLNMCLYPEDVYTFVKEMQSPTNQQVQVRLIDDDQSLAWFEASIQSLKIEPDAQNQIGRLWCLIARERTQWMKEKSIQDAKHRMLKGILHRMPIMLYRSRNNRNWTMEYVSEGCLRITGHSELDLINTPLYGQLIHPEDREYVWFNIQQALAQHCCFHIRYRLIDKLDSIRWVQEIGQGAYSDSGMVLGVDGIIFQTQAETNSMV